MIRTTSAQIGLLAFAVALVAGLYAGNAPAVVLFRALLAMFAGAVVGQFAGWAAKYVLREHFQRRKMAIDREHITAVQALQAAAGEDEPRSGPAKAG